MLVYLYLSKQNFQICSTLHEASSFTALHHWFTQVFHPGKTTIIQEMRLIILPTVPLVVYTL